MKYFKIKLLLVVAFVGVSVTACDVFEVEKVISPNFPSSEGITNNATEAQLQNLVTGLESANRIYVSGWWETVGIFGREAYEMDLNNPDNAILTLQHPQAAFKIEEYHGFGAVGYEGPYVTVRQTNLLILAVKKTNKITDTEKNGYIGFSKTIKGYQLLIPLMRQWKKGIRVALPYTQPLNPGPFLSYDEALAEIRRILEEGATALRNAGESLNFTLSMGFDGYDTPEGLLKVNRAIAARAAIYAEDWQAALDALSNSFLKLQKREGVMWEGPAHTFSGGNDQTNPFYYAHNAPIVGLMAVNPEWIQEAEPGDERVENKIYCREESFNYSTLAAAGLPPVFFHCQMDIYNTRTSPIPFIRNEELILIYAEAHAQLGHLQKAVKAINIIRNTWSLDDFHSASKSEIMDQILYERRYSLWMEGHRWIDMRRYGRIDEIETDLDGGRVPLYIARPVEEIDWECYENPETC